MRVMNRLRCSAGGRRRGFIECRGEMYSGTPIMRTPFGTKEVS